MTDNKNAKRLSKEEIKKKLLDSITIDEVLECEDLNKESEEVQDPERAAEIIQWYEDIIKMKNKGIINVTYHQGQDFQKFKEKEKFTKLVNKLGIHKTTIIFKINVFKLCKKHPKFLKSSIGLEFFKNYHKSIKAVCEEYEKEFNVERFYLLKLSCYVSLY